MIRRYWISLCVIILLLLAATISLSYAYPGQDEQIPMHPFWQGDYGEILGCKNGDTNCQTVRRGRTISKYGCNLVSMSMLYWAYGFYWIPNDNHEPTYNITDKLNPRTLNNYLADFNSDHFGFDGNYRTNIDAAGNLNYYKTTSNFYYYYPGNTYVHYHYLVPNYECQPFESEFKTKNGRSASCFQVNWSDSHAKRWLDYDISWGTGLRPAIMQIKWKNLATSYVSESHFVVIAGYEKKDGRPDDDGWYRAHNPMFKDNEDTRPKPLKGETQYGMNRGTSYSFNGMVTLYRFAGRWTQNKIDTSRADLVVRSPVEIQVIDPDGNKIGYDPETGTRVLENPMSLYYEDTPITAIDGSDTPSEPVKRLTIIEPPQGNYIFKLFGTGDGPYTIDMEWIRKDGTVNLERTLTGTAYVGLQETYHVTYSPTSEATLSNTNQIPVANAGSDQTGEQSYEITLDGSLSHDPDGDPLKYSWSFASKPEGSIATLSDANAVNPTFIPDLPGTYTLQLIVNDYFTDSSPSAVTITATPVKSQISVTPNFSTPLSAGSSTLAFDVNNIGRIGVSNGIIDITLKDPDEIVVYTKSQAFSITVGETKTIDIPVTIPSLKFGNYTLTYTQFDETRTGSPTNVTIPNSALATFSFDKITYRVRETANLTLNLMNNGKFNLDNVSVTVSVPDAGYSDTKNVNIGQRQTQPLQYAIPISETITPGQHNVNLTLTLPSGSSTVQTSRFAVQESVLVIGYSGPTTLIAGDTTTLTIENTGAVDTTYTTEKFSIIDNKGGVIYQGSATGTVLAGEEKVLTDIQIPAQTASGLVYLYVALKDTKTGKLSYLYKTLNINGIMTSLFAMTDKEVYLNTEAVTALTTLASGAFNIEGGTLNIKVNRYKKPTGGAFTQFLPKGLWPFSSPHGVAIGPDGSVYVTDFSYHRIQKFDSNGNFTTKWGSQGSDDGQFYQPSGISVSPDGYVYVVDTSNNRIQKFDSMGNFIAKWGSYGSNDGQFNYPYGIAVAPDGSVYVADTSNYRIQKFDSNGNFITKWGSLGSGNGQFYYHPQGIAIASDGSVYVADTSNYRIQKFDSNGNFITKWGSYGSGDGQFNYPWYGGIAADTADFVYVVDSGNSRIQKFDSNGNFIAKWGSRGYTGNGQFNSPSGIAVSSNSSVYVADSGNRRIQKFDSNGTFITKWGSSSIAGSGNGQFSGPYGIAVASDGSVYVADTYNYRIQKFDSNGNFITKWGSYGSGNGQFANIEDIAVGLDSSVYVIESYNNRVQKFASNGNFILKWGSQGSGNGQFYYPKGIAVGPDGSVYVADTWNNRVQKFDRNGNFLTKWGSYGNGDGQFKNPSGIAAGADGSMYVTDENFRRIQKFDSNGNFITKFGYYDWNCDYGSFGGVAVAPDGSVYATNACWETNWFIHSDYHYVEKFDSNGNFITKLGSYGSDDGQFQGPNGIVVAYDGSLYVADTGNSRIQRMEPFTGGSDTLFETTLLLTQPANVTLDYPTNIGTLNTTGKLYLEATLKNSLGQTITTAEYPFYIVDGNTVLSFNTDKKVYKPYETVSVTGEVKNLTLVDATNLNLVVKSRKVLEGAAQTTIYTKTFDVPAGGIYPFTFATTAGTECAVALISTVSQNNLPLAEATDQYEVATPKVSISITAPDIVGKNPFDLYVEIKNTGKVDISGQLYVGSGGSNIDYQLITISAGETRLFQYTRQITQTTTYTVAVSGDVSQSATKAVTYGEAAAISIGSGKGSVVYAEGKIGIPVTITNTGQLDEALSVAFTLQSQALTQTKTYFLPKGGSVTDTLYYDLTAGSYQLSAVSTLPYATANTPFTVAKENNITMANSVGTQGTNGLIPVAVNLTNNGYNEINGSIQLAVMNNQGKAIWRGEAQVSGLKSMTSSGYTINVNSTGITAGAYKANIVLYSTSGQQLATNEAQIRILGPIFEITSMPTYPAFTVGREAAFTFTIKNTGNQEGTMSFSVRATDILNQSVAGSLMPSEEKSYAFSFTVPEDAEGKDYLADYALTSVSSQGTIGQTKFRVAGINVGVTATLDKTAYRNGDTALLTLTVSKLTQFDDGTYLAIIRYGAYHDMQSFMLSKQPATLTFSVPLAEITGENLFYGIHFESGKTICQNSLSINMIQPDLIVTFAEQSSTATVGKDDMTTLSFGVVNQGETASNTTTVTLYDGENLIETKPVKALNPEESENITVFWNVLGKAGEHTIKAVVDPDNTVTEFNEENNTAETSITVPDINLITETDKDTYKIRQKVNINSTIKNLTAAKTYQNLTITTSAKDPSGNEVYNKSATIETIQPANSTTHTETWSTTGLSNEGTYTITQKLFREGDPEGSPYIQNSKLIALEKAPDFTIRTDTDYQKIKQGEKATYTAYLEPLNGWNSEVALNIEGLPQGTSVSFNPGNFIPPGESLTVIITTDATTAGTHSLTLAAQGVDEGEIVTHTLPLTLDVSGFELSAEPSTQTVKQLETTTFEINLNSINGYEGEVNLSIEGVPNGMKASLGDSPDSTALQAGKSGTVPININVPGIVRLTVLTSKYVRPGTYTFTITGDDELVKHKLNLNLNLLSNPEIAAGIITTQGPGPNNEAWVKVFNSRLQPVFERMAFNTKYGAYATGADIDGDGYDEIIVSEGPDPKNTATLRAFKRNGSTIAEYTAFDTKYGLTLSAGDIDGDWKDELIVGMGPDPKNPATLKILKYNGSGFDEITTQTVFDTKYGLNTTTGDIDGDGISEIITAAGSGPNNPATVKVWKQEEQNLIELHSFEAFEGNYGANITTGDIDGDGKAEIITGTGPDPKNPSVLRVFKSDGSLMLELRPYDNKYGYGVTVATTDIDEDGIGEIITGLGFGPQNPAWVKVFKADGTEIASFLAYPENIGYGVKVSTGRVGNR